MPPKKLMRTGRSDFSYRNEMLRERILTSLSHKLTSAPKILWYAETLVLSARYLQRLTMIVHRSPRAVKYPHREKLWLKAILPYLEQSEKRIHVAEFGVAAGKATKWWHRHLTDIHRWDGFDTFEGLPSPWIRGGVEVMDQGVFAPENPREPFPTVPGANNLFWHKGLISDTISQLSRSKDELLFVLIDVDLLAPTRDVLAWLLVNGRRGDCVYFDEAFDPFNEGLALTEAMENGLAFEVVAFTGSALAVVLK